MQNVSRFESNLLRLLYYFLRREPIERAMPLVEGRCDAPKALSAGAVRLVKDALAKGCTFLLAQRGGWRDERHLRKDKPVGGRLWQRTPPEELGLTFSRQSMEFLSWIAAARPGDKDWNRGGSKAQPWGPSHDALTPGDLLLLFFAHEGLRETVEGLGAPTLRKRAPFMNHALCWLAYPEDFTQTPDEARPRVDVWMKGVGSCIVEALQPELAARWIAVEASKEKIEQPQAMRALGASQDRILDPFLEACEKANRRDLARFLLRAGFHLLGPGAHPGMWTGSLQMTGQRLTDRAATYQAGLSLLRHFDRLAGWTRWARASGYLDEGYAAAQLWLLDWEQFQGDTMVTRAQSIIRNLDPMRQAAAAQA